MAVERELDKWSWAAFLMGGIWAIFNRVWIGLLCFVPVVGIFMTVVLGMKGRRWAWERTRHRDFDRFVRTQRNWVIAWVVLMVGPVGLGLMSALAIYGVRQYVVRAKQAEARTNTALIAQGMVECIAATGSVPASSTPVPPQLAAVSGAKYQSVAAEWGDPAFACAGFSISTPQMYQYRWLRTPSGGLVVAAADLSGKGAPDSIVTTEVTCPGAECSIAPAQILSGEAAALWFQRSLGNRVVELPGGAAPMIPRMPSGTTFSDGLCDLRLPPTWAKQTAPADSDASLYVENLAEDQSISVISEFAEDFEPGFTVKRYAEVSASMLPAGFVRTEQAVVPLGPRTALREVWSGTAEGVRVTLELHHFRSETHFHKTVAVGKTRTFAEARGALERAVETLRCGTDRPTVL